MSVDPLDGGIDDVGGLDRQPVDGPRHPHPITPKPETRDTRRGHSAGAPPRPMPTARPLERAQLVWQHARRLADPGGQLDPPIAAVELLATSHHDPTEMAHALALGQTHLRNQRDDAHARDALTILERAIEFLGVKPDRDRRRT